MLAASEPDLMGSELEVNGSYFNERGIGKCSCRAAGKSHVGNLHCGNDYLPDKSMILDNRYNNTDEKSAVPLSTYQIAATAF